MMFDSGYLEATILIIALLLVLVIVAIGAINALVSIRKSLEQGKGHLDALRNSLNSRMPVQRHSSTTIPGDVPDESYAARKDANIPDQLRLLHNAWLYKAQRWERIYYTLTILSVLFATLVATGDSLRILFPKDSAWFELTRTAVAIAAALTTGLLAAFNPYKIYEDYIGAWRIVNTAKLEYLMKKDLLLGYLVDQTRVAEESLRESRRYDARVGNGTQAGEQLKTETEKDETQKNETQKNEPLPQVTPPIAATMPPATSAPAPSAPIPSTTATPTPVTPSIPATPSTAATMPATSATAASTPMTSTTANTAPETAPAEVSQTAEQQSETLSSDEHAGLEGADVKATSSEREDGASKEHDERKPS